jgi:hypothetical protein
MSAFSLDLENKIMDHILGTTSTYSKLGTVYMALFTVAPTESGGGTEATSFGYARLAITNNATNWNPSSNGMKSNATAITFPAASGGSWGTVTHWAIMSAASAGDILFFGAFNAAKTIADTDTLTIPIGQLTITLD